MTMQELLDAIGKFKFVPGEPHVPPPELIAFCVRLSRSLRQWEQKELAFRASVSITTVERGEKVGGEALDQIAVAFGYEPGHFTTPRIALSLEDAVEKLETTWGNLEPVPVRPLKTHRAIQQLAKSHSCLIYRPGVSEGYHDLVAELGGRIQEMSFILDCLDLAVPSEGARRRLYEGVRECVVRLEDKGFYTLGGVMNASHPEVADLMVGILVITPKSTDPGARKRRQILVDRRLAEPTICLPETEPETLGLSVAPPSKAGRGM